MEDMPYMGWLSFVVELFQFLSLKDQSWRSKILISSILIMFVVMALAAEGAEALLFLIS
jgi:hypothetical protein